MKVAYRCRECKEQYAKWQGQCLSCKQWNTLEEISEKLTKNNTKLSSASTLKFSIISEIKQKDFSRIDTGISEVNRVLGGGLVSGEVVLIAGQPGAGKSTLLLQILSNLSKSYKVYYISGEESEQQVAMRARRLSLPSLEIPIIFENDVVAIENFLRDITPDVVVIDSIQVMMDSNLGNSAGSLVQVRETANRIINVAKQKGIAVIFVGHVTKEGTIAGPKVLEHSVDCSLLLDNTLDQRYRLLKATKNRFGDINEVGVLAMTDTGLKEIKNPSAIFLSEYKETSNLAGNVVSVIMEGNRAMLVEVQALVEESTFAYPKVLSIGYDQSRLAMLIAIISRYTRVPINKNNVYLNIAGGVSVEETSLDLAIVAALLSSSLNIPLKGMVLVGEVGLSGEIRPVMFGQERIKEAGKQKFSQILVPEKNLPAKEGREAGLSSLKNIVDLYSMIKK